MENKIVQTSGRTEKAMCVCVPCITTDESTREETKNTLESGYAAVANSHSSICQIRTESKASDFKLKK